MPSPEPLAAALAAARAGGVAALALQGRVATERKADGSQVSAADLASDRAITDRLRTDFPDLPLLSEETAADPALAGARRWWAVDPIDGTSEYLKGSADWAVQVALVEDGRAALGALVLPRAGLALWGAAGQGAWIEDASGRRALLAPPEPCSVLTTSASSRNRGMVERLRAALPAFAWLPMTSVGVKVHRLLAGQADLYVHARVIQAWDAAAPAAVLLAAGGSATDLAGGALHLDPRSPSRGLLFSTRPDHQAIASRLAGAGIVA